MLFLAVTLGFFVENQREHFLEHKREKKLIADMLEDIKRDSTYLSLCINRFIPNHSKLLDSAIMLLEQPGHEKDRETYQAYLTATEWNYNYIPTERTLSQLRSYGHRLIRNPVVADVLSELEILNKVYYDINDHVHSLQNDIDESAYVFADMTVVSNSFITEYPYPNDVSLNLADISPGAKVNKMDPDLKHFIAKLRKYNYYVSTSLKGEYMRIIKTQGSTINILKKEYHLK